jgi:hypothetical protein
VRSAQARDRIRIAPAVVRESAPVVCLDQEALCATLASLIDAAAREAPDEAVRIEAAPANSEEAWRVAIGPAHLDWWQAPAAPPDDNPLQACCGIGLPLVTAAAILRAHGGAFWSVGGHRGVIGVTLPAATRDIAPA